jgi:hypothetical protein
MFHLIDRLVIFLLIKAHQAPIFEHTRVQEVLIDGNQLVTEQLVEVSNDLFIAFHR